MKNFLSKTKKYTLLYFYPKDNTPGCTLEANDFSRLKEDFGKLDIEIFGVSRDSDDSHKKFSLKNNLQITLISDEESNLHNFFGVIGEKKNYWKIFLGTIRSTFLLDSQSGEVVEQWRNVRAKGHVERILWELRQKFENI